MGSQLSEERVSPPQRRQQVGSSSCSAAPAPAVDRCGQIRRATGTVIVPLVEKKLAPAMNPAPQPALLARRALRVRRALQARKRLSGSAWPEESSCLRRRRKHGLMKPWSTS
jgi:hypothetical protein